MFDTRAHRPPTGSASYWMDCPPISALSVNKDLVSFFRPNSYAQPALRSRVAAAALADVARRRGRPRPARARAAGRARRWSRPSSPRRSRALVQLMNLPSDNFFAEVLNKRVAVGSGRRGTMRNGRRVTRQLPPVAGHQHDQLAAVRRIRPVAGDRLSAVRSWRVLGRASTQPYAWAFRNSLPIAGVNGTLSRPHAVRPGARQRAGQDRHAGRRLRAVRLRHQPQRAHDRVLDPDQPTATSTSRPPTRCRTGSCRSWPAAARTAEQPVRRRPLPPRAPPASPPARPASRPWPRFEPPPSPATR